MISKNVKKASKNHKMIQRTYFLTELTGLKVKANGKKIGKLADLIILDREGDAPVVTHIFVSRSFGDPSLLIPWEKVVSINHKAMALRISNPEKYVGEIPSDAVPLKDYVLDKKILDMKGKEIEVVYDVKLTMLDGHLYVNGVDFSRYGFLRRIKLKWLADAIYGLADRVRDQTISWKYVQQLPSDLGKFKGNVKLKILKEKLGMMHPVDLAGILTEMEPLQRRILFNDLETKLASDTLEEIGPSVQRDLISSTKKEKIAALINQMTPAKAADVLSGVPWYEIRPILKLIKPNRAQRIRSIIDKGEKSIEDFSTTKFIEVHSNETVSKVKKEYQNIAKGKDVVMYLYIIDDNGKLIGVIDIKELLQAEDKELLKDVMISNVITLKPTSKLRKALMLFSKYSFRAIPIVGKDSKMVGVVLYKDIMEELSHTAILRE